VLIAFSISTVLVGVGFGLMVQKLYLAALLLFPLLSGYGSQPVIRNSITIAMRVKARDFLFCSGVGSLKFLDSVELKKSIRK